MTLFYNKVLQDELLEPIFRNMSPQHVQHVANFISEVFKGPTFYTDDPEFRSTFVGQIEWGTRVALIYSQLDENPLTDENGIPTWGWGEVKGPYGVVDSLFSKNK